MASGVARREARGAIERVCRDAVTADDLLEGLSDELHRIVPHEAATWFGMDPATLIATAPSRIEGLDPGSCDTFWHLEFHEQDTGLFADLPREGGASALRLSLDDRPARSIRYRDFMKPQGYEDELRAVFRTGESTWGVVGLYRDSVRRAFDEDDVAVLRDLGPMVASALRKHVRASRPWSGEPCAPGLLLIDTRGQVVSANSEALCWLEDLWQPSSEPSAFGVESLDRFDFAKRDLEAPTSLFALVARARAVADGRDRAPARLRLRDRRGRWLVLHASSMSGPSSSGDATVAVVLEAAKASEIAPVLIEAYGLTKREQAVLGAIARGASTAEIAAQLFLSPHTVRDYVKAVFEKLGVSSRGELVARVFGEHFSSPLHETMIEVH